MKEFLFQITINNNENIFIENNKNRKLIKFYRKDIRKHCFKTK